MPAKRARTSGGSVTGGTGDIKPQFVTSTTPIPAGAADYSIVEIIVPRIVLNQPGDATVMEILRVDYYLGTRNMADVATTEWGFLTTVASRATDETSTLATLSADLNNPSNFAFAAYATGFSTNGGFSRTYPISIDMNDGNGNGYLIGTNRIFFITGNVDGAAASEGTVKIMYRMSNVTIVEYVGMVADQQ